MRTLSPARFRHHARHSVDEIVYCPEAADFYATSLNSSVREALASLRASNSPNSPLNNIATNTTTTNPSRCMPGELTEVIGLVEQLAGGRMYELMSHAVRQTTSDAWSVMCHGDLWVNNLMFSYDDDAACASSVVDVRLIDLQAARCASPAIDLLHFLYTSTERRLRDAHMDDLLAAYAAAVCTEVARHVRDAAVMRAVREQFALGAVRAEMRSKIAYALGISMWLLPAVTFHPDRIPDLNTLTLSDLADAKQETVMIQMQSREYHERIRDVVLEFEAAGYFGSMMLPQTADV